MVARIPPPPEIPVRVDLEYRDEPEEKTPAIGRRCQGCGGFFRVMDETAQPPGSHAEAWTPMEDANGRPVVCCRGTPDPDDWSWCKNTGELNMPNRMAVRFFVDRRKGTAGDRRRMP